MITPTIHLNGTSARDLAEVYSNAARAVDEAIDAIAQASPNGRDYYPQGPDAMAKAVDEHSARLEALRQIRTELEELCVYCVDNTREGGR